MHEAQLTFRCTVSCRYHWWMGMLGLLLTAYITPGLVPLFIARLSFACADYILA